MTIHPSTRFHLRKKMSATNFTDLIMGAYALDIGGAPALARPSHQSFRWGRIGVSPRVSPVRPDPRSQRLGNQRVRKAAFGSLHPLHVPQCFRGFWPLSSIPAAPQFHVLDGRFLVQGVEVALPDPRILFALCLERP